MARCSLAAAACRENLNTGCVKVKAWGECGTEWGLVGWSLAGSHKDPGRSKSGKGFKAASWGHAASGEYLKWDFSIARGCPPRHA